MRKSIFISLIVLQTGLLCEGNLASPVTPDIQHLGALHTFSEKDNVQDWWLQLNVNQLNSLIKRANMRIIQNKPFTVSPSAEQVANDMNTGFTKASTVYSTGSVEENETALYLRFQGVSEMKTSPGNDRSDRYMNLRRKTGVPEEISIKVTGYYLRLCEKKGLLNVLFREYRVTLPEKRQRPVIVANANANANAKNENVNPAVNDHDSELQKGSLQEEIKDISGHLAELTGVKSEKIATFACGSPFEKKGPDTVYAGVMEISHNPQDRFITKN